MANIGQSLARFSHPAHLAAVNRGVVGLGYREGDGPSKCANYGMAKTIAARPAGANVLVGGMHIVPSLIERHQQSRDENPICSPLDDARQAT